MPKEYKADYTKIAAVPTTYSGVLFRSRLEARWAAFFDLCGWDWAYEPSHLDGWLPDFLIRTRACDVLAEVKPIDLAQAWGDYKAGTSVNLPDYGKATQYSGELPVILLGRDPLCLHDDDIIGMIVIADARRSLAIAGCTIEEFNNSLRVEGHAGDKWLEAEDKIMGRPPRRHSIFPGL